MPELPEVQTIIDGIAPIVRGAVVAAVHVDRLDVVRHGAKRLPRELPGKRIVRLEREGKRIIFRLDPPATLVIHLGMSGRLTVHAADAPVVKHTHLRLRFVGRTRELRFRDPRRFGGVWFLSSDETKQRGDNGALSALGPDALSIRVPQLRALGRRKRQIKALLLDQNAIAGLGNIYCDEALFGAGIHPLARACDLTEPQIRKLACSIRKTLRAAIDAGGSTLMDYRRADGSEGLFQAQHRVYGREGRACRRCGRTILRIQVAGRSTHVCPNCQNVPKSGLPAGFR